MPTASGDRPVWKSRSRLLDKLKRALLPLSRIHRYLPSLFNPLYPSLAFYCRSINTCNTPTLSITLFIRDTSVAYGVIPSWAEDLKKEYASKMAIAKQKRKWLFHPNWKTIEECKLQGEFLEKVTTGILQDKGFTVLPHNVGDRYAVDHEVLNIPPTGTLVAQDDFVMEDSNTNVGTYYPRKRHATHLSNLRSYRKRGYDGFWLASHKKALENIQKDLDQLGVEVLEIGKVVLPENLDETYHMVKEAIDSKIPDALQKRERGDTI